MMRHAPKEDALPETKANGISIHYEEHGDPSDPAMLLIMGFGAQLTLWPDEFVEELVGHGFRVIRYDNRDIGLSHKFDGVKAPGPIKLTILSKLGFTPKVPYSLADMADDGAGLLDALGIEKAHIVGASMGGMIAQHFAARHADRAITLTSVFSSTGDSKLPRAESQAIKALVKRPASTEEDVLVDHGVMLARTIGSPDYPSEESRIRDRARANVRRSFYPEGPVRQMAAIMSDKDRTQMLEGLDIPTLVLHGEADPLIPVAHGQATAAAIPGAKLRTIPGWGHDLPLELVDELAAAIATHAKSAQ